MDENQKTLIRLKHWIDHNLDHLMGYKEVAAQMDQQGFSQVAENIRLAIDHVEKANGSFEAALFELESKIGPVKSDGHGHDH